MTPPDRREIALDDPVFRALMGVVRRVAPFETFFGYQVDVELHADRNARVEGCHVEGIMRICTADYDIWKIRDKLTGLVSGAQMIGDAKAMERDVVAAILYHGG